jgi:hypothetical protein
VVACACGAEVAWAEVARRTVSAAFMPLRRAIVSVNFGREGLSEDLSGELIGIAIFDDTNNEDSNRHKGESG